MERVPFVAYFNMLTNLSSLPPLPLFLSPTLFALLFLEGKETQVCFLCFNFDFLLSLFFFEKIIRYFYLIIYQY
jgi:hypothetical protein